MCNCYTVTKKSTKNWTLCVGSHFLKLEWSWKIRWKCFQSTRFIKNQQLLKKLKIQYFIITYSSCPLAEKVHEHIFFKTVVCLLSYLHLCIVRDFILWNSSEYVLLSWMLFLKKGAPWQLHIFNVSMSLINLAHVQSSFTQCDSSDYVLLSVYAAPDKGALSVLSFNNVWWLFSAVCYFNHFNVLCLLSSLHMLKLLIDIYAMQ